MFLLIYCCFSSPPVGCPEPPKNTREMAGILQAAKNIEFEPLEAECEDDIEQEDLEDYGTTSNAPVKYQKLKGERRDFFMRREFFKFE